MERSLLNEFFAVPLIGGTGGNGFFDTFFRTFHRTVDLAFSFFHHAVDVVFVVVIVVCCGGDRGEKDHDDDESAFFGFCIDFFLVFEDAVDAFDGASGSVRALFGAVVESVSGNDAFFADRFVAACATCDSRSVRMVQTNAFRDVRHDSLASFFLIVFICHETSLAYYRSIFVLFQLFFFRRMKRSMGGRKGIKKFVIDLCSFLYSFSP